MKYVIILADGMADYPVPELSGRTPMECAKKPTIDKLASKGEVMLVKTVPDNLSPGSDVANLSVMGYDTAKYYTGRSPLEAASMGVVLSETETSFRANLVSLSGEGEYEDLTMKDYSSDEITTEESAELIKFLCENLKRENIRFYNGISYRHLMVWDKAPEKLTLVPPHDISGKAVKNYLPDNEVILEIMKESRKLLSNHPINIARRERGLNTADSLWIWGEGKKPGLKPFKEEYGLSGAVVSAVDLVKGIGRLAGMKVIEVPGVTGNVNTNFKGKAEAAVNALCEGYDLVYVHMEAPDECGHRGEFENKVKSIEIIDEIVVKYITEQLSEKGIDFKMMVLPDHPTPIITKTHARDPVPCLIYDSRTEKKGTETFTEKSAGDKVFEPGHKLMEYFIK